MVHIDRLTLRGVEPADRTELVEGFKAAIIEQLSLPGVAESLTKMGHRPSLTVRPVAEPSAPPGRLAGDALGRELSR